MKNIYKFILVFIGVSFYLSQTVSTANAATCNWKSRNAYASFWDSCSGRGYKYSVNGYLVFKSSASCFKYQWTVNGNKAGTGYVMSYPITANGSYTICVKVTDTCNSCDTTFCSTRTITCVNNCNWKALNATTNYWDSCNTSAKRYSLNGDISFKTGKCLSYFWTVNGIKAGYSSTMNYKITANGSYKICVQVYDSCNKCDTTYCTSRTITCVSGCNWKGNGNMPYYYQYMSDSCPTKYYYGYLGLKNTKGISYTWKANGNVIGTGASYKYKPSAAGYYNICVVVYDSLNKCDTTLCKMFYYNCTGCNWKSRNPYYSVGDSCDKKYNVVYLTGYTYFNYSKSSCLKYKWTVNGSSVSSSSSSPRMLNYTVTKNGSYVVCMKVTDTCNNCDTTFCITKNISCISGSSCNWKNLKGNTGYWDSCNTSRNKYSLNAYISFTSKSCLKYKWTVNGNYAGNSYFMNYPITANGSYSVCVKVTDTCNNCDTSYCTTRTVTCVKGSTCNWKSRNPYFATEDSCDKKYNLVNLTGYIAFNYSKNSCFKYQWTINGTPITTARALNYTITKNGSYVVCMKVIDTCNNCDTIFCSTKNISCITGSKCNWKSGGPAFSIWDSCDTRTNQAYLIGQLNFKSAKTNCFKYKWTVNGSAYSGNYSSMGYYANANGTYTICVNVKDTCNNCDTTFCMSKTVTCIKGSKCNWKDRKPAHGYWDSCSGKKNKYSLNAYSMFTNYFYKSCLKYQWTVNGNNAGNGDWMSYPITANGTYNICVKVTDTCMSCDTTYCTTYTIKCVGTSKCNWKSRSPNYYFWDSCGSKRSSLNGYIAFGSKSCLKYQWMVNGNKAGNGYVMNYPITANGKYSVCVTVTDTCKKCDTTYCSSRTITCFSNKCNWNSQGPYIAYWDSCSGKRNKYSLNAYISFTGGRKCHVYQWTVNGKSAGNGYVMSYPVAGNGTYSVCLKVTDTCNNCDTTFCTYRVFNCGSTKCNWKSKNAYFITKDTCITSIKNYSVNGVVYLGGTSSCFTYQWTVNSASAGTNQYMNYTITQNGTYYICVKVKDTCNKCDTTYCTSIKVTCVPAGINKVENTNILNVYPNPTSGLVNIELMDGTSTYNLTNSMGQILQTGTLENGVNTLDMTKYATGLYLIQVRTGNAILTEKISVQKR